MRRAACLLPMLLVALLPARPAAGAAQGVAWRLGLSDVARYERARIRGSGDKERRVGHALVTVYGHDLRDGGQYAPASPVPGDLLQLLALRLPAAGAVTSGVKFDWRPRDAVPVRVRGTVAVREAPGPDARIEGHYKFHARGRQKRDEPLWYDRGTATTTVDFDRQQGVVRHARIEIAYRREDMRRTGPKGVVRTQGTWELVLQGVDRARPADFQKRVDGAIARGLAHLRSLQREDGTFKPHGDYVLGTTALAVLALLACDVPRDDPSVRKALDWMFQQEPKRTYEQALCLMAVDRAWTPRSEREHLAAGHPVEHPVRDLSPERMAWARRTAHALETGASSPGSWGYPPKGTTLLRFDTSNTQYAALGLRAATHLGYPVAEGTWLGLIRHCKLVVERKAPRGQVSLVREGEAVPDEARAAQQNLTKVPSAAGFRYSTLEGHDHVCGSMTCAAITILRIARHQLQLAGSRHMDGRLRAEVEALVLGGWAWLDAHWAMDRHPMHPSGSWYWYWLYSLERAGVLDRVKRVGGKDWYYEGAMQLLYRQGKEKGDWNNPGGNATPPTCFALLFLRRGTSPLGTPVTGVKRR
jgi:hypothetical protein